MNGSLHRKEKIQLENGIRVMKFDDGTYILYDKNKESLVLNDNAAKALLMALEYGYTDGEKEYILYMKKVDLPLEEKLLQEDYKYTLEMCQKASFIKFIAKEVANEYAS